MYVCLMFQLIAIRESTPSPRRLFEDDDLYNDEGEDEGENDHDMTVALNVDTTSAKRVQKVVGRGNCGCSQRSC